MQENQLMGCQNHSEELNRSGDYYLDMKVYVKALYYFQQANNPYANIKLSFMYFYGLGVKKDISKAYEYFDLATKQYNPEVLQFLQQMAEKPEYTDIQYLLGYMYYYGKGVKQEYNKYVEYYKKAMNYYINPFDSGYVYYYGEGVKQDYAKALYYFKRGERNDCYKSQFFLGLMYYYGHGVKQNYSTALCYFGMAAKQGHIEAVFNIAYMYHYGMGVKKNCDEAIKYYIKICLFHRDAQYGLGLIYRYDKLDYKRAIYYFKMAAEQDHIEAMENLGDIYLFNNNTGIKNYSKGAYYTIMAAVLKNPDILEDLKHLSANNGLNQQRYRNQSYPH